jgi:hypothetical protein
MKMNSYLVGKSNTLKIWENWRKQKVKCCLLEAKKGMVC